ncbi:MAG: cytochrome b/b6 domain-containing protein [Kiritimatiellaeota bacterium]|nr:cytochrome b/b6 domain-containing protein [Kiritimatiellota bacterium]
MITNTSKALIWDWPIRVFHWAFALCVGGALALALLAEDGSKLFIGHMLLGIVACFLLLVRIALGLFGNRYNRFPAMLFSPAETFRYCWSIVTFRPIHYVVHNPGAAAAAFGMYGLVALLLWSGFKAEGELARNIHIYLAYGLLALALGHLAGVTANAIHSRGEAALSMLTGKRSAAPTEGLSAARPLAGLLILLLTALFLGGLCASYNTAKGTVLGVEKSFFQASEE